MSDIDNFYRRAAAADPAVHPRPSGPLHALDHRRGGLLRRGRRRAPRRRARSPTTSSRPAFNGGVTKDAVIGGMALVIGIGLVRGVSIIGRRYFAAMLEARMQVTLRTEVVDTYLDLPMAYYQANPTGELLAHADADVVGTTTLDQAAAVRDRRGRPRGLRADQPVHDRLGVRPRRARAVPGAHDPEPALHARGSNGPVARCRSASATISGDRARELRRRARGEDARAGGRPRPRGSHTRPSCCVAPTSRRAASGPATTRSSTRCRASARCCCS